MTIRGYNEIDEKGVLDLLEELRGSNESGRFSFSLKDSKTYKELYLKHKNYIVLVAFSGNVIAGFMIAEHTTNDVASLLMLYVGLDYRRKGIAFLIKTEMEKLCRMRGYDRIVSQVRTNNYESIALNEKAGWIKTIDKVYPDYYYWFTKEL